ncbi:MAG: hypothetical protein SOW48_03690 [Peptoniphilaceae bacterium]|nr:hypothetical protein [Peptoniphilaceae bacterium]MDY3075731.1 hypothetical protein [Peptoniphilaceae bacterium]
MRKSVIFARILTLIFATVGCTANNKPGKNSVVSSSSNAVFDVTQAEDLSEKTENKTVNNSIFEKETTQPTIAKTDTEKVSKKVDFFTNHNGKYRAEARESYAKEMPKNEIYEPEITINTVSEVTTSAEQIEEFSINFRISYAQHYAQSIGFNPR